MSKIIQLDVLHFRWQWNLNVSIISELSTNIFYNSISILLIKINYIKEDFNGNKLIIVFKYHINIYQDSDNIDYKNRDHGTSIAYMLIC